MHDLMIIFKSVKWLPVDQLFKLNKLGLVKKVIDGRAPETLNYNLGLTSV